MDPLYESYIESAKKLTGRIIFLNGEIAREENPDRLESLKLRRRVLYEERRDLLSIARCLKDGTLWSDFF
ncbi:MAG: hypothetical protein N2Z57_03365 [Oscillospiraceae bacterium]|jgi:hypothetical protein|nr:hypothetical protein [Oscillospiraceae bacterium]MCX7657699.1 hypothetical protein [Oscillospiraceae bacterium]MDN5378696.1 hypothetical protein [Clostridiales bacterium]HOV41003.1 hypothetical protein [Oscillospiraceae bacterium]